MLLNRGAPVFGATVWCLLSLWLFFGCLELAEELHFVSETVAEDQEHQDLDEEALSQLASGLKADSPNLGPPGCASVTAEIAQPPCPISLCTLHQLTRLMLHDPPSLRLHQQLSVYRI
jgi:hypothetical protein